MSNTYDLEGIVRQSQTGDSVIFGNYTAGMNASNASAVGFLGWNSYVYPSHAYIYTDNISEVRVRAIAAILDLDIEPDKKVAAIKKIMEAK